jgi:hypothetical protein
MADIRTGFLHYVLPEAPVFYPVPLPVMAALDVARIARLRRDTIHPLLAVLKAWMPSGPFQRCYAPVARKVYFRHHQVP